MAAMRMHLTELECLDSHGLRSLLQAGFGTLSSVAGKQTLRGSKEQGAVVRASRRARQAQPSPRRSAQCQDAERRKHRRVRLQAERSRAPAKHGRLLARPVAPPLSSRPLSSRDREPQSPANPLPLPTVTVSAGRSSAGSHSRVRQARREEPRGLEVRTPRAPRGLAQRHGGGLLPSPQLPPWPARRTGARRGFAARERFASTQSRGPRRVASPCPAGRCRAVARHQ